MLDDQAKWITRYNQKEANCIPNIGGATLQEFR